MARSEQFKPAVFFTLLFLFLITPAYATPPTKGIVKYQDVPGMPLFGRISVGLGHDTPSLTRYKSEVLEVYPKAFQPDFVTLYTNFVHGTAATGVCVDPFNEDGTFNPAFNEDLNCEYNFGANVHNFEQTLAEYPEANIAIGLFLSDNFRNCTHQTLRTINAIFDPTVFVDDIDPQDILDIELAIDKFILHLKNYERIVYLRIGYEFDSRDQCYEKNLHKAAFRYFKQRIDALEASNIATVWQAAGWPRNAGIPEIGLDYTITEPDHYEQWYPGDDVVDYVAYSAFYMESYKEYQWACSDLNPELFTETLAPRSLHERILDFARSKDKPVMVAEAAPQAFDLRFNTASCIFNNEQIAVSPKTIWEDWYANFFQFVRQNRDVIRVVHYINSNWQDETSIFACVPGGIAGEADCPSGYWGDHTLQDNYPILKRFNREMNKGIYTRNLPWFLPEIRE